MDTRELIQRYLEETNIQLDENNRTIIFYGSRVTGEFHSNSDLDVLVVTSYKNSVSKKGQMIDGIKTETFFVQWDSLEDKILCGDEDDLTFFDSVFNTGIVEKDEDSIVSKIKWKLSVLKQLRKKTVRKLPQWAIGEITSALEYYEMNSGAFKKLYYYSLIEWIRVTYHYMYQHSTIFALKTYNLYSNVKHAEEDYKLDLPSFEFRNLFLQAIGPNANMDESLEKLFSMIGYSKDTDYYFAMKLRGFSRKEENPKRIQEAFLLLNKDLCEVESMLLYRRPEAEYNYFLLLIELKDKCSMVYGEVTEEFGRLFSFAIEVTKVEDRIRILEELFHSIDCQYHFDYDDYSL